LLVTDENSWKLEGGLSKPKKYQFKLAFPVDEKKLVKA
jgi:hypothetical protein